MYSTRYPFSRSGLLAGAALCATLLVPAPATAQTPATSSQAVPSAAEPDVDLDEAPQIARVLRDEATHRERLARIHRLRELAQQGNMRERLAQIDDLERRERAHHEARTLLARSELSERSARGMDDIVRRGGTFRARGRDIAVARERKFGPQGNAARRSAIANTPDRPGQRTTRPGTTTTPRSPSRSSSGGSRSPR